jgi:hypothetical protein
MEVLTGTRGMEVPIGTKGMEVPISRAAQRPGMFILTAVKTTHLSKLFIFHIKVSTTAK